jgi:uncharacterized protein
MGALLRLIILAALVWFVISLVRRALSSRPTVEREEPPPALMRQCAQCGVHLPEKDCIRAEDRFFCCEAHRDAHLRNKP